jgi:hypothetical protein
MLYRMVLHRVIYLFMGSILLLFTNSCSLLGSDNEEIADCILEEIRFDEFNSLRFQTISGGRIYRITQQFIEDDEVIITGSYQFNYYSDRIVITDQENPDTPLPFMTIDLENDRPVRILRYFATAGVRLYHDFSYPEDDLIRIDLTREASTGDVLYVGYSLYYLNGNGNIIRNERFRADEEDPDVFNKIEDRTFTYDDFQSPQENLYLPFFAASNFPDVKFFSENNILSFTDSEENQTFQYQYQYGENNSTVSQILPTGQSIQFEYVNCPE